ncbi:MAG TPA: hypothetical protein P5228_09585 [Bacteroidales bacterium]|nr:hypothetical protein [Bacteroidales bacterium]HRZ49333.1 hypothetical protein [Bacteroidales bacterium]
MKKLFRLMAAVTVLVAVSQYSTAQNKTLMLWDDTEDLLSNSGETMLISKLAASDIEIVMTLDYKKRCDYVYAELNGNLNKVTLSLYDCNKKVIGTKSWLSKFFSLSEEERVTLLAYAIVEIIENPQLANVSGAPDDDVRFTDDRFTVPFNHHTTRYFFSPSSFNLRRGELYYNTVYFATHDLQYGITDHFSVGMGTTPALLPFYVTPKYSFPLKGKHAVSIGTLFFIGTWGTDFFGNLGYGTYTYGDQFNNVTIGLGHFYFGGGSVDKPVSKPLFNVGVMARMSDYLYFVTENYYLNVNESATAYFGTEPSPWQYDYMKDLSLNNHFVAGMSGFRFINKSRNVSAWQFGLTYVLRFREALGSEYKGDNVYISYNLGDWNRFVIPTISFVSKLGKRI